MGKEGSALGLGEQSKTQENPADDKHGPEEEKVAVTGYSAHGSRAALWSASRFRPYWKGMGGSDRFPIPWLAREPGRGLQPRLGTDLGMVPREIGGPTQGQ